MTPRKLGPASEKHRQFLTSNAKLIVYGGAAAGGKTYNGLMRHLRFKDDPNYVGYVIRKNSTAIMKEGGIFSEAIDLYKSVDPKGQIKLKDQKFIFSSGASITFSHYESDVAGKELYRGLQISGIMYDESSQATADQIFWLLSRNRSKSKYNAGIWLTTNPSPDCFLYQWVKWYLYPEGHPLAGRPNPERDGRILWMLRAGKDVVFAETAQELLDRFGPRAKPFQFQFISATIYDNPPVLADNPDYLAQLEALPHVERERMLYGNWLAREESSGFWKREWVSEMTLPPPSHAFERIVRAYDLAGSLPSEVNPDPDYSVGVKMGKLRGNGGYIILDVKRFRARFGQVTEKIIKIADEDGTGVDIIIPRDPGQAGQAASMMLARDITAAGYGVRSRSTSKSKVDRFRPFSSASEHLLVRIIKNCCTCYANKIENNNDFFYNELEAFDGGRKGHDDCADAVGDAYMALAQRPGAPLFSPPELKQANPYRIG